MIMLVLAQAGLVPRASAVETLASGSWTDAVTHGQGLLVSNPTISHTFTPSTPVKKFARLKVTCP